MQARSSGKKRDRLATCPTRRGPRLLAWFISSHIWVATTDSERCRHSAGVGIGWPDGLIPREPDVAEHFQPVGVSFAGQQFRRAFADPFRPLTPQEAMVVEKELEQGQIVRSQMAAQEEVAAQPAVEVLDDGTGADGQSGQFGQRGVNGKEAAAELAAQLDLARPARRILQIEGLGVEDFA